MTVIRGKFSIDAEGKLLFLCPGCNHIHAVRIDQSKRPSWSFNGDYDKPTFNPSILCQWAEPSDIPEEFDDTSKNKIMICHSFVRDGNIELLSDCTHEHAGKTLPIPEFSWPKYADKSDT